MKNEMSKKQTEKVEYIKMVSRLSGETEPTVEILDSGDVKVVVESGVIMTLNRKGEYV